MSESLSFSLNQPVKGLTPEFAQELNKDLGVFKDETKMEHLALIARNPERDIWGLSSESDMSELINWSNSIERYDQTKRRIINNVFRKISIFEELRSKRLIHSNIEIAQLSDWRYLDFAELCETRMDRKVIKFLQRSVYKKEF